jgi:hypothetical protein
MLGTPVSAADSVAAMRSVKNLFCIFAEIE